VTVIGRLLTVAKGVKLTLANGRNRPTLLKKSAMVCASEKYAPEIEIFIFGKGIRTRISRSSMQKKRFHQSMIRQFGQTDFFNRIGHEQLLNVGMGRGANAMNCS
jgi:hypothetical protein